MELIPCEKHGECGITPTVSKDLSDAIASGEAQKLDVATIYLKVYDEGELLFEKTFFVHANKDMTKVKDSYVIENDADDELFSRNVSPLFSGGGHCVKCFKEYMDEIEFDLNNLRAPSGITILGE